MIPMHMRVRTPSGSVIRIPTPGMYTLLFVLLTPLTAVSAQPVDPSMVSHDDLGWSRLSLGVKLGVGFNQHVGTEERDQEYEVSSGWRTGISAGVFVCWPLTSRFALQQEILYSQKGSRQDIGVDILEIPTTLHVTYDSDYLDIPVLARLTVLRWSGGEMYTMSGTAMSLRINGRYSLDGVLDDGTETVPISAEGDLSEVDMFDFSMVYGTGVEMLTAAGRFIAEYRFSMGWNTLQMPTYAYVPFGDEQLLVENEPVPLKNQSHSLMLGVRF